MLNEKQKNLLEQGKEIIKQVGPQKAKKCNKDTFLFFEELALKIREVNFHKNCYRKCPFRRTKIKL